MKAGEEVQAGRKRLQQKTGVARTRIEEEGGQGRNTSKGKHFCSIMQALKEVLRRAPHLANPVWQRAVIEETLAPCMSLAIRRLRSLRTSGCQCGTQTKVEAAGLRDGSSNGGGWMR